MKSVEEMSGGTSVCEDTTKKRSTSRFTSVRKPTQLRIIPPPAQVVGSFLVLREAQEHLLETFIAHERFFVAAMHNAPLVDDDHRLREALGLFHVMRGQKDRLAGTVELE